MTDALYSLYFLFKTTESTAVCLLSEQQSRFYGQAVTAQPEPAHSVHELRPYFTSLDFGASIWKLEKINKKKHKPKRENPYTSCFQERTLCVCKATKQKGKKKKAEKKEKKKRKNFLFLVRTKEGYLTDFFHL